ncbi:beta-lactamase family protein [Kineosporia rhizophila]|uniref:serine hydrolase domain-containing protein n=1 Tax=Kineosporia rhizophila TaxID=84633 RepID=UPI001E5B3FD5|nr:beta-lactamase family protein [Kineosporia rhizophila]
MSDVWGDAALAGQAQRMLGKKHPVAAVASVNHDGVVTAGWGAPAEADFEIGSISKGVTGLLYRDAVERGVLRGDTRIGELLPVRAGCPVAGVELEAVSKHRSGIPSIPSARSPYRRSLRFWWNGTNPYGDTVAEMIEQAGAVELRNPRPRYSNFAFELLGHAVAAAQDSTYPELVQERIAGPLGLKSWYLPATEADLRPGSLTGRTRGGRPRPAWPGQALAPAGGVRSSIGDLAELTRALLEERVAGLSALDPVARFVGGVRIGAAWITLEHKDRAITWHNGGTGGFRTWLGMDREAGCGVVVLSATAASVDQAGFRLLSERN